MNQIRQMPEDFFPEIRTEIVEFPKGPGMTRVAEYPHMDGHLALGYRIFQDTDRAIGDQLLREAIWQALEIIRLRHAYPKVSICSIVIHYLVSAAFRPPRARTMIDDRVTVAAFRL